MIKVSVVYLIDKKSESMFSELNDLYSNLMSCSNSFELIVASFSSDIVLNNDLNIFCGNKQYCKFRYSDNKSIRDRLYDILSYTDYETIILLNSDVDYHAFDLDYVLINYTALKSTSCFALYECSSAKQSKINGVVLKHIDLINAVNRTNAKSITEFMLQCCMLHYYIGNIFRLNNRESYFKYKVSNINFNGLKRLRLSFFLRKCKLVYNSQFKG